MAYVIIVIPCYNESRRLDLSQFTSFSLPAHRLEFCFVNDGSRDDTLAVLNGLRAERPDRISVLDQQPNAGKAEAVRRGVLTALDKQPDYIGFWDADLATPLGELPGFCAVLDQRPAIQMVFGSRVKLLGRTVERRAARHYLGRISATLVSITLRLPIYDTQCGAKLFRVSDDLRQVFTAPFLSHWIFDVEIIARFMQLYRRRGAPRITDTIYELPLMQWRDVHGSNIRSHDFATATIDLFKICRTYLRD